LRAAGNELIRTVLLRTWIVALLVGGLWKLVPGGVGICGGMLSAVLRVVAAARPIILTLLLRLPLMEWSWYRRRSRHNDNVGARCQDSIALFCGRLSHKILVN
jgi:hypothetical protein